MRFGSICSGIEASSVAWHPLGMRAAWFAEIEAFPSAVLTARWPDVPNHGDFTRIGREVDVEPVELLVGGTPCQSFSVAGKRLGLEDPRGNLTLEFIALAGRLRPRWVVWENVPGVLSDDGGRTFGAVLGLLGQLGYGLAYRVLDAQFFGVPQRRRRVFVVGHLGAWQPAAAVLLEPACLRGDSPPRREAREDVARPIASSPRGSSGYRNDADTADSLIPFDTTQVTSVANRSRPQAGDPCHPLATGAHPPAIAGTLRGGSASGRSHGKLNGSDRMPLVPETCPAIKARDGKGPSSSGDGDGDGAILVPLAYQCHGNNVGEAGTLRGGNGGLTGGVPFLAHALRADGFDASEDGTGRGTPLTPVAFHNRQDPDSGGVTHPLGAKDNGLGLGLGMSVRRLTPRECERLQGFPDDYTAITYRAKPAADGPRYRALGNSMAVPVMAWIGLAILEVDAVIRGRG